MLVSAWPSPVRSISSAQTKKKKKPVHPKSPACRTGCKPDTTTPALDSATPEDASLQKELSTLARELHQGAPGSYEKLAAFANKNSKSVWGQRAALALGYDDYTKARSPQALVWLAKAKSDTLLEEYTLFWTAQTERTLHKNGEAAQDLAAFLRDHPNTVIKDIVLQAYVPTTVDIGRPQEGLDALAAYPPAASKPASASGPCARQRSGSQTGGGRQRLPGGALQISALRRIEGCGTALTRLNKMLHGEFPYATAELQDQRAQAFYDAHKWKEARAEYEKLASMLKDHIQSHPPTRAGSDRRMPPAS